MVSKSVSVSLRYSPKVIIITVVQMSIHESADPKGVKIVAKCELSACTFLELFNLMILQYLVCFECCCECYVSI